MKQKIVNKDPPLVLIIQLYGGGEVVPYFYLSTELPGQPEERGSVKNFRDKG